MSLWDVIIMMSIKLKISYLTIAFKMSNELTNERNCFLGEGTNFYRRMVILLNWRSSLRRFSRITTIVFVMFITLAGISGYTAYSQAISTSISGKSIIFEDMKNNYTFSDQRLPESTTDEINALGKLTITGNTKGSSMRNGFPSYSVKTGNVDFSYVSNKPLISENLDQWHLVDDPNKSVDSTMLDEKIGKGAIIIQTSKDGIIWVTDEIMTNVFDTNYAASEPLYTSNALQLTNGCYYRIIVAYKTRIRTGQSKFLFFTQDDFSYQKNLEIYEFYLFNESLIHFNDPNMKHYKVSNDPIRTEPTGYTGAKEIKVSDPFYNLNLGDFTVSGFTEDSKDTDGNPVFLKNLGDQVTLWFKLQYDINHLNGNAALSVVSDEEGFDNYFRTTKQNFGKGTLIIRHTDFQNIKTRPTIYTNYLEANAKVNADTKVGLYEEGDYEVALNYKIKYDKTKILGQSVLPQFSFHRVFFKFSVRNGNCMVFPFDLSTGAELSNTSITPNGFYLDLAKSRYLSINVKREIFKEGADGLTEDTRFNKPAKDGEEYKEEGVYTITVKNQYTNQETTKKIYVGSNPILKAHVFTQKPISEIKKEIASGATINEDGSINMVSKETVAPKTIPEVNKTQTTQTIESTESPKVEQTNQLLGLSNLSIGIGVAVVAGLIGIVKIRKRK